MDEPEVAADGPSAHAGPDPQPGPEVIAQEASSGTGDKKVSWAELFFDLVFVVAVTRVSALVEYESNAIGLVQALVTFVPIYWLWVGVAVLTNQSDVSEPKVRLKIFLVALAGVFLALSLPEAFGRLGLLFALSYWFGRIVLGWRMLLTLFIRPVRLPLNPYTVSMVITGPLLVIGALSPVGEDHGVPRMVVWGVAALIDLSTPTVLAARLSGMHYDAGHLSERFVCSSSSRWVSRWSLWLRPGPRISI